MQVRGVSWIYGSSVGGPLDDAWGVTDRERRQMALFKCLVSSSLVLLLTIPGLSAGARLRPQVSNAPFVDRVVVIGVFLHVRGNVYAPVTPGTPVVYVGEAVQLDVTVTNGHDVEIALGERDRSWVDDLRLTVLRQQHVREGQSPTGVSARARFARTGPLKLAPDRSINDVLNLQTEKGQPLPPGMYTIAVELPTLERVAKGETISRRQVRFEVREPISRADILDHYLHQSYRARVEKRREDQRSWLNRAIMLHPNSLAAWLDLADAYYRHGDCQNAIPALKRGIGLLTSNADPELRVRPRASHAELLQQQLTKCLGGARTR
jgi:hypothetical protein